MAGRRITKREKLRLAEQEAKRKAKEEEEELKRLQALERQRAKEEEERVRQKQLLEEREHTVRKQKLAHSCKLLSICRKKKHKQDVAQRAYNDWRLYVLCEGVPNPSDVIAMNTYMFLWQGETDTQHIDKLVPKGEEVLRLLTVLDDLIDNPLDARPSRLANWKEVRHNFRSELQQRINMATFNIIRNFEETMEQIDLEVFKYMCTCPFMTLCLWTRSALPKPHNYEPESQAVDFADIGLSLELPVHIVSHSIVVRALRLSYDHLSDTSHTWSPKPLPKYFQYSLFHWNTVEYELKLKVKEKFEAMNANKKGKKLKPLEEGSATEIKEDVEETPAPSLKNNKKRKSVRRRTKGSSLGGALSRNTETLLQMEDVDDDEETGNEVAVDVTGEAMGTAPEKSEPEPEKRVPQLQRTPSQVLLFREKRIKNSLRKYLRYRVRPQDLNMRQHVVLGGIYYVEVLEQPDQPVMLKNRTILTLIKGDERIRRLHYYEKYTPPPPKEEDDKPLHSADDPEPEPRGKEDGLNRLVLINIKLPDFVLWFEPPTPVQWSHKKRTWTSRFIYDNRFNEDKQMLTFRVGSLLPIGLSTQRFINLPYQTWELRPDWKGGPGSVFLSITAATIIVEFIIKDNNRVCLNSLQNASSGALQELVGVYLDAHELVRRMRRGGVDVFPDHDAGVYMADSSRSKHHITESHAYQCMALLSTSYNFSWSRWNLLAGPDNIVMQMREFIDRKRLPNYNMLLVTPQRALLVECTEVSQAFNNRGTDGMDYYPDIYWLAQAHSSPITLDKIQKINLNLMQNVYFVLSKTRVLSFS
ncbi:dynein intermediate chain CFAP94, axonemal [Nilaparvata lugens]|uniref:dynein intermediate chain CFAP94, axonemal n=1 Tax=Nilaparvata lugens TaxID=108931 RepID=UPI000B982082|nr:dynein intermediate chain CFAP94, axonemal [Nilaparvata lugens]XP_022190550.1 dynein intermediate chain CFAP94, axonemal [Nilaparvata lugens]XP_039280484.1 dynein intermediate chain CFAP94, axonemal [Nilaparvata lugens]